MKNDRLHRLKASLHIEEVVGNYISLHPKGNKYFGLCPFHADRHPSLQVNPATQTYACFACGEHGDVFEFVRKMEHCSLGEAVSKLEGGRTGGAAGGVKEPLAAVGRMVIRRQPPKDNLRFLKMLLPYACGCSELTPAYLDFEVGQSPVQVAEEWKTMCNRIVFPVRDEEGELVGFGARRLSDEDTKSPKYINSSASDGYDKGGTLYGLNRARAVITKEDCVFLTEGYKDTIAMHAAGFINTVALCGTALTGRHIALLKKYTKSVYLLLDGDEAGQVASRKAVGLLRAAGMDVESLLLPGGEDPDSLFRCLGREAFAAMIGRFLRRPHSSECALLTACLLYPDATYPLRGETCSFVDLAASALTTDDLLFESGEHLRILSHLLDGGTEQALPEELRKVASALHEEYDAPIRADLKILYGLGKDGAAAASGNDLLKYYLVRLLFIYSEARALRIIRRSVRLLLQEEEAEVRQELVLGIAARREQLRHISEWLRRPGAVF